MKQSLNEQWKICALCRHFVTENGGGAGGVEDMAENASLAYSCILLREHRREHYLDCQADENGCVCLDAGPGKAFQGACPFWEGWDEPEEPCDLVSPAEVGADEWQELLASLYEDIEPGDEPDSAL